MTAKVTILIPHYKTLELTKLCLRLLRKNTHPGLAKVVVIDNGSKDESTEYLRGLKWITLIEREPMVGQNVSHAHSAALDLALKEVDTPYVLSIHTDTLVKRADWLPFLLSYIEDKNNIAGVGSWKVEQKNIWQKLFKVIERAWQKFYFRITGKKEKNLEGIGKNFYYLRSHCALYRTSLLKEHQLSFGAEGDAAGKVLHRELVAKGYQMKFLASEELLPYLDHINHATMVLNPELGLKTRRVQQGLARLAKRLGNVDMQAILQDDNLDR